jgi:hypothetical protein
LTIISEPITKEKKLRRKGKMGKMEKNKNWTQIYTEKSGYTEMSFRAKRGISVLRFFGFASE